MKIFGRTDTAFNLFGRAAWLGHAALCLLLCRERDSLVEKLLIVIFSNDDIIRH